MPGPSRTSLLAVCCGTALLWSALPAKADLRMCNTTSSRIGVAIGYRNAQGWTTEGWWNISPRGCETLLRGTLAARFYYVHAIDYDKGGEWTGKSVMCVRNKEFTIRGIEDCLARGYDRAGFFEALGDLLQPGPTLTNVNDCRVILIEP